MLSFPRESVSFRCPSPDGRLLGGGFTDRGRTRLSNQDCFHVSDLLLAVADGMGGHRGGDIASQVAMSEAVDSMGRTERMRSLEQRYHQGIGIGQWPYGFDPALSMDGNRLRTAIYAAHMRLLEAIATEPGLSGMGTTLVAAVEREGRLAVAWAGDSRLYVLRYGQLRRLTRDDSWAEAVAGGDLGALGIGLSLQPWRSALVNAVGVSSRFQVHVMEALLEPGDVIALTTDGVHGWLDDRAIVRVLGAAGRPGDAAADLVATAIGSGSTDNCTAIVAHF